MALFRPWEYVRPTPSSSLFVASQVNAVRSPRGCGRPARFTEEQVARLREKFAAHQFARRDRRRALARELAIDERRVANWFGAERSRFRKRLWRMEKLYKSEGLGSPRLHWYVGRRHTSSPMMDRNNNCPTTSNRNTNCPTTSTGYPPLPPVVHTSSDHLCCTEGPVQSPGQSHFRGAFPPVPMTDDNNNCPGDIRESLYPQAVVPYKLPYSSQTRGCFSVVEDRNPWITSAPPPVDMHYSTHSQEVLEPHCPENFPENFVPWYPQQDFRYEPPYPENHPEGFVNMLEPKCVLREDLPDDSEALAVDLRQYPVIIIDDSLTGDDLINEIDSLESIAVDDKPLSEITDTTWEHLRQAISERLQAQEQEENE